jgi:hypothetical protein
MTQKEKILKHFKLKPFEASTPREVHRRLFNGRKVPLTSTRRAITDLAGDGELVKLNSLIPETFGRGNHLWIAA